MPCPLHWTPVGQVNGVFAKLLNWNFTVVSHERYERGILLHFVSPSLSQGNMAERSYRSIWGARSKAPACIRIRRMDSSS
jgi:hypothetical protein